MGNYNKIDDLVDGKLKELLKMIIILESDGSEYLVNLVCVNEGEVIITKQKS